MTRNSGVTRSGDLDSLPSWISDYLGQGSSYMADEVDQSPSSPVEGSPEENPLIAIHPSVEEKTNIMTIEELNALRETYSFPPEVRVRLPDEGETITSTRPGEVAFYEAAFPAGLRFPLHNTMANSLSVDRFRSSLAVRSREAGELASLQEGRAASMETEIARLQKVAADLDQQLAESALVSSRPTMSSPRRRAIETRYPTSVGGRACWVNELREALNKSKDSAMEEFKSSSEFMVAVEDAASKILRRGV
ncbi:hypothetical protein Acr_15g0003290 [Actinidia rufa]|uniref:Uncharacterized protein n=1 Tax=Actinidia rufa TaxID=165716 RepID=A0A7J0FU74_9ERIC|nr:hypothetical protein Acr_15g0003290 [Actinidia rufa]